MLLRDEPSLYARRSATPSDTIALVEVADASLRYDRGRKLREYARARIPEYWIVNVPDDCVEVYRHPSDLGYRDRIVLARGASIKLLEFPDDPFLADDLLPG